MLWYRDHYRRGVTRLSFANGLYQVTLFLGVSAWSGGMVYLCAMQVPMPLTEPGTGLLLLIYVLVVWLVITTAVGRTYSVIVGSYGILQPRAYCGWVLGVLGFLLVVTAIQAALGFCLCIAVAVILMVARRMICFHQPLFIGKNAEFFWHAGRVRRFYQLRLKRHAPRLHWAGMEMPFEEATRNFLLLGAVSSGKTISLRLFIQSFVPLIGKQPNLRALIYDAKRDMVSIIRGMNHRCPMYILNPYDARCTYWQIDQDILNRSDARAFATALTPSQTAQPDNQDFWMRAAFFLIEGLSLYFAHVVRENWTFRDVLIAMRSLERLTAILKSTPLTEEYLLLNVNLLARSASITCQLRFIRENGI